MLEKSYFLKYFFFIINACCVFILFLVIFPGALPTSAAMATAKQLIQCGIDDGNVMNSHSLIGHRQAVATDCPGNALYAEIKTWDNYDPSP
jgi:N-acetylmuramoyl-L-alanine amidase